MFLISDLAYSSNKKIFLVSYQAAVLLPGFLHLNITIFTFFTSLSIQHIYSYSLQLITLPFMKC